MSDDVVATVEARSILLSIWAEATRGRVVIEPQEFQLVMAVFRFETGYGKWPEGSAMEHSHNWAAHQCPRTGKDCSPDAQRGFKCALHTDTIDGTEKTRFHQCFRIFDSHEEGAADGLKTLYVDRPNVPPAMKTGDALLTAHAMKRSHFYSKAVSTRLYAWQLFRNAREIAAKLGEPLRVTLPPCPACGAGSGEPCAPSCSGPGPIVQGETADRGSHAATSQNGAETPMLMAGVVGVGLAIRAFFS